MINLGHEKLTAQEFKSRKKDIIMYNACHSVGLQQCSMRLPQYIMHCAAFTGIFWFQRGN